MQTQLLLGPTSIAQNLNLSRRANRQGWLHPVMASAASSSSSAAAEQNHYAVLGLALSASSADIKTAYRFLARKYHPDVSKDSQASEVFKSIRQAYEVLSNEATRTQYDRTLKFRDDTGRQFKGPRIYDPELDDWPRIYRSPDELKWRTQRRQYWEEKKSAEEEVPSSSETGGAFDTENTILERGSFGEVLRSAFVSLFLLQIFGSRVSLTFSSFVALFDRKLDGGYKVGYIIAWILGGRNGVLLTLCFSFMSWICGKTSSGIVALGLVAMWVGSVLARIVPLPRGSLITLLYMSIKLQADLN